MTVATLLENLDGNAQVGSVSALSERGLKSYYFIRDLLQAFVLNRGFNTGRTAIYVHS